MSNTNTTTPTRSTATVAPDYAVPDSQKSWDKMWWLVNSVVKSPSTKPGDVLNDQKSDKQERTKNA